MAERENDKTRLRLSFDLQISIGIGGPPPAEDPPDDIHPSRLARHLYRFFGDREEARRVIEEFRKEHPGATNAQIFQAFAAGNGRPSTHISGARDGELKTGGKKIRRRANRYRY